MTATTTCLFALVVAAGCGNKANDAAKETGKESAASKAADLPEAAADKVAADKVAADKPDEADQGGTEVTCEKALANSYAIVESQGTPALKKAATDNPVDSSIAECKREGWSADLRGCLAAAKTVDDVYHDCYVRPLKGHPLKVQRTFDVGDPETLRSADPKIFTQDGDFFQVREGCGFLYADTQKGGAGMFVVCDGKTRGPMTTPDEVTEAFAVMSADMARQHAMVMSIINKMPSGRFGGWKVCDQAGNCHIE